MPQLSKMLEDRTKIINKVRGKDTYPRSKKVDALKKLGLDPKSQMALDFCSVEDLAHFKHEFKLLQQEFEKYNQSHSNEEHIPLCKEIKLVHTTSKLFKDNDPFADLPKSEYMIINGKLKKSTHNLTLCVKLFQQRQNQNFNVTF